MTATYFFFLLFAQFAFLEQAETRAPASALELIMAAMGITGLLSSLFTAYLLKNHDPIKLLRRAFLGCAFIAALSPRCSGLEATLVAAVFIGLALGCLTVSLATGLIRLTGPRHLGLQVGLGTGCAYFLCNMPLFFQASPDTQALMASVACVVGYLFNIGGHRKEPPPPRSPAQAAWFTRFGFAAVVICFFALIWMDSAVFYVIQQNGDYKAATWSSSRPWINGPIHLLFALIAGLAIDRGYTRSLFPGAYLLLCAGAIALIAGGDLLHWAAPLYVAGVSLYSVALVAFPSLSDESSPKLSRRWRAGFLYGVAGWVGSAMGIGMARDLQRIPPLFLILAGVVLLFAWLAGKRRGMPVFSMVFVLAAALLTSGCLSQAESAPPNRQPPSASAGRLVYIAEGCIHCHSQYVRPGTSDVERWGPYQDVEKLRTQRPPLFGNRRQGPDLLNVGNRRSEEWQRLHLRAPRLVSPGSTMPAYAHLFENRRGEDLVAYLQGLGRHTLEERMHIVRAWKPAEKTAPLEADQAGRLFKQACSGCHGQGPGAGLAATHLSRPVRNLSSDPFLFVLEGQMGADLELARFIKFGIPGTNMPGHEYLTDSQVLGLRDHVLRLRKPLTVAEQGGK